MSPEEKRRFMHLAFHPNGGEVCQGVGMVPMSGDVEDLVQAEAMGEYHLMMSGSMMEAVLEYAEWYTSAMEAIDENNLPTAERSPQEHLVTFFLATCASMFAEPSRRR